MALPGEPTFLIQSMTPLVLSSRRAHALATECRGFRCGPRLLRQFVNLAACLHIVCRRCGGRRVAGPRPLVPQPGFAQDVQAADDADNASQHPTQCDSGPEDGSVHLGQHQLRQQRRDAGQVRQLCMGMCCTVHLAIRELNDSTLNPLPQPDWEVKAQAQRAPSLLAADGCSLPGLLRVLDLLVLQRAGRSCLMPSPLPACMRESMSLSLQSLAWLPLWHRVQFVQLTHLKQALQSRQSHVGLTPPRVAGPPAPCWGLTVVASAWRPAQGPFGSTDRPARGTIDSSPPLPHRRLTPASLLKSL